MAPESKRSALVFLLISMILTALIGAGLPRLKFLPGMPLPSFDNGQVALPPADDSPAGLPVPAFAGILFLIILAVLAVFLIVQVVKGIKWKELLSELWSLSWKLLLLAGLLALAVAFLPRSQGASLPAEPLPPPKPLVTGPLGPVPSVLIWLAGLGLVCLAVFIGAWMIAAKRRPVSRSWEWEVEKARQALLAGQDLRDVIIQCYRRMGQALQEEQQIEREAFMTTGEFELLLSARGIPHDPVHQLTRLFDAARYGRCQPAAAEEQSALHCLEAILEYSRQSKQAM